MMIRQAFEVVQNKKSKKFIYIIASIVLLFVLVGAYTIYQSINISKQKELAENIFYDMKTMEVELSILSKVIMTLGDKSAIDAINRIRNNHSEMSKKYDQYVDELGIYNMDEQNESRRQHDRQRNCVAGEAITGVARVGYVERSEQPFHPAE